MRTSRPLFQRDTIIGGGGLGGDEPVPLSDEKTPGPRPTTPPPRVGRAAAKPKPKIMAFEQKFGSSAMHEDNWNRTPNTTGMGAIHVKSFHCKLSEDGLHFVDQQINEWLDKHPQYEVKFVTTSIGEWQSKLGKEQNLIVQVWV